MERVNIHGRRPGRGLRPYLIVAKLVCVAAFLGGLMTLLATTLAEPPPQSQEAWAHRAEYIGRIYRWVIVPGVTGAEVVGVLLFVSIWRVMLRMRWFLLKAALIIVCMPTLHVLTRHQLAGLRMAALADSATALPPEIQMAIWAGAAFSLVLGILLLVLGRIKPRLGQDYGRTFASTKP
jgi:hypothetical protein